MREIEEYFRKAELGKLPPVSYIPLSDILGYTPRGKLYLGNLEGFPKDISKYKCIISVLQGMRTLGNNHYIFSVEDDIEPDIINKHILQIVKLIENNIDKGDIYIHCAAGMSRSATAVVAYIMAARYISGYRFRNPTLEAIKYVRKYRSGIRPNPGFINSLIKYEKVLCPA